MRKSQHRQRLYRLVLISSLCSIFFCAPLFSAQGRTPLVLNGNAVEVYFSDGDTFKILTGELVNVRARLEGFNTLESYGTVHQWGRWKTRELLELAKDATTLARRGPWHCETDKKKDAFGRILVTCDDLALDLITKGLAHSMTVTKDKAKASYRAAQKTAMENKEGMWALGIPEFITTSLHSINEPGSGRTVYDRLVSTVDGHSEKKVHNRAYADCEMVCHQSEGLDAGTDDGIDRLGESCMLYVGFNNRFGINRPSCLN